MQRATRSSIWLMLLAGSLPTCSRAPTWFNMPFDHARAYVYNLDEEDSARWEYPGAILWHGELNPTVANGEGVTLTAAQLDELRDAATHGKNETAAMCFNPRHAFVFYDGDDRPVAWFEVCFECSNYAASPIIEDPPDMGDTWNVVGSGDVDVVVTTSDQYILPDVQASVSDGDAVLVVRSTLLVKVKHDKQGAVKSAKLTTLGGETTFGGTAGGFFFGDAKFTGKTVDEAELPFTPP